SCSPRPPAGPKARRRPPRLFCGAFMQGGTPINASRLAFVAAACELAAERMTDRDLEKVRRLHERMARHHAAGERPPYFKLNHEIHLAIVAASNNAILQAI